MEPPAYPGSRVWREGPNAHRTTSRCAFGAFRGAEVTLLREGDTIRGTYEVERLLGEGAFGEVYRVKHRFLGRQAMKVFKAIGMSEEENEVLLAEARLLSAMGHPNIVRVFDANLLETQQGTCGFFTMEYVAGGSLEQFWQSHGGTFVPLSTSVEVILQACRGLAVAHLEAPPVIHRDIKPQNLLVGYDANGIRVRVSDFGLAKRVNPLTLMASARGTRCFKSPEAFKDWQSDSCAGDVWALGCSLYLLLTDRLPFPQAADSSFGDSRPFEEPPIPPSRLNIMVDANLERIALRALAVDPRSRYPNARDMLQELERWRPDPDAGSGKGGLPTSAEDSKAALGPAVAVSEGPAREMARKAVELARGSGRLAEAADLMEEAFNKWPDLREQYEYQLRLWRRGIAM